MNLGLISETTLNANTGTSVYTNELSKNLTKYCKVFLFIPSKFKTKEIKDKYGRNIIYIQNQTDNFFEKKLHNSRKIFLNNLKNFLDNNLKKYNLDVFHCLYGHYFHFLKNYKKPIFWTCHNLPPNENTPIIYPSNYLGKIIDGIFRFLVRAKHKYLIENFKFDKIIVPSNYVKRELTKNINVDSNKIIQINNGITLGNKKKKFSKYQNFTIISLTSFKYHKNIHLIPKIIHELKIRDLQWIIIGNYTDKKYFQQFKKSIEFLKLKKNIVLKQNISENEKIKLLRKSHLYVQLSSNEGFGIPLLEAKINKLDSLSTICGASKEITKSFGGYLLRSYDTRVIAKKILKIKSKKNTLVRNSKNQKLWSWQYIAYKLYNCYNHDYIK